MNVQPLSVVLLLVASTTTACSQDVSQCEASVKKTLINPETAEFFDSRVIKPSEYVDLSLAAYQARTGSPVPVENRAQTEMTMHNIMKKYPSTKFVALRLKAEGRLGNKITSEHICLVDSGKCTCSDLSNG